MTVIILLLTRKFQNEKLMLILNIYTNIKSILNIIISVILINKFLGGIFYSHFVRLCLTSIFYIILSTYDSYLIFRKMKAMRQLEMLNKEYILRYLRNMLVVIVCFVCLSQVRYLLKDSEDLIFILACMFSIWIYQFISPYIIMLTNKVEQIDLLDSKHELLCINMEIKTFKYEGKSTKSANAFVVGTGINRHIFVSDYFIENSKDEEVFAIMLHELGHVKFCDIEKRIIFLDIFFLLFFGLSCVLDYIETNVTHISIPIGIMCLVMYIIGALVLYRKIQQFQEMRADKYAVTIMGDKYILINAIKKLYNLNDLFSINCRLMNIFSTHPQIQNRIQNILKFRKEN